MTVPVVKGGAITAERLAYISLMREIEDFLNLEADLIDGRSFSEWLALFSDDLRYWMPMRKNLAYRDRNEDITAKGDIAEIRATNEVFGRGVRLSSTKGQTGHTLGACGAIES
ncbi:MAG: hypothetical protein MK097_07750, partial [Dechloromonas sp.]|nr:hypothetical protein [Dechloromonas sp.]